MPELGGTPGASQKDFDAAQERAEAELEEKQRAQNPTVADICGIRPVKPQGYDLWKSGQPATAGSPQHTSTPPRGVGRPENTGGGGVVTDETAVVTGEVARGTGRPE